MMLRNTLTIHEAAWVLSPPSPARVEGRGTKSGQVPNPVARAASKQRYIRVGKRPEKLSAKDEATKARLEKLPGAEFDRAYMAAMVKDHTHDVTEFRTQARTATDPAVKNFASETLPTLESHLKDAREVDRQVTGTAATHKVTPHTQTGS